MKFIYVLVLLFVYKSGFAQVDSNALYLDGSNHVEFPFSTNATFNVGTGDFTTEAWIRLDSVPTLPNEAIILGNQKYDELDGFRIAVSSNQLVLYTGVGGYGMGGGPYLNDNSCHHIAITRASGTVSFYIDGFFEFGNTMFEDLSSSRPFLIGAMADVDGTIVNRFVGPIKEVRFWNVARSQAEIQNSMNNAIAPQTGLIGYWRMNEGTGNNLTDYSGNGNDGLVIPAAAWTVACAGCTTPIASITASGPINFCAGSSVDLIADTAPDYSFQWQNNSVDIPGATNSTYTATTSGAYKVLVSNSCGTSLSNGYSITVYNIPVVIVSDDTVACDSSSVVLSASGASTYTWSPATGLNATYGANVTASPTVTTTYTVVGTVGLGCSSSETAVVTVSNCPIPAGVSISNTGTLHYVNWLENDCAVKYRVRVKNLATGAVSLYVVNAPNSTKTLMGLEPNTLYKVQVRTQCSSTGTILSPWTSPVYFTTGASVCTWPTNLSATPVSSTSEIISWTTVAGSAGYQLRYRVSGTITWTPIVINNGAASIQTITTLQPNTTYDYQMRTKCSISPLTWSNYTSIQTFTTPLRLGDNENNLQVQLYPNPSNGNVTFNSNGLVGTLSIYDAVGKTILHQGVSTSQTTITALPTGLLTYKFIDVNGHTHNGKFVVLKN